MSAAPPSNPPQAPAPRRSPKPLGVLVKLLLMSLVFAATLGLAEVVLRFTWSSNGRSFTAETALDEIRKAGTLMQEGVDRGDQAADDQAADAPAADAPADDAPADGTPADGTQGGEPGSPPKVEITQFLHPYFGWDVTGPHSEYVEQRDMFIDEDPDGPFDVVILGGSVAAGFGWTGKKALFNTLLADKRLKGRKLRMFNHGIAGFKQPQQMNRLAFLFSMGYLPDLVINLDGFNEVALGRKNSASGIHPLYPSGGHWARMMVESGSSERLEGPAFDAMAELRMHQLHAEECVQRAEELGLNRFVITTELATWWIRRIRSRGLQAYERFIDVSSGDAGEGEGPDLPIYGPPFVKKGPRVMELLVESWANASLSIHGMCAARGVAYLHVLQPTLHDKGSKPLTQEEIDSSGCSIEWKQGAELGYPMLRKAGQQLEAAGVNFFDASMIFADVEETLYFDACHFDRKGQEKLGRAIARDFRARLPEEGPGPPPQGLRVPFFQERD